MREIINKAFLHHINKIMIVAVLFENRGLDETDDDHHDHVII